MSFLNRLENPHHFSAATIPSLANKVIIVTGGNAGIGLATVLELSKHSPAHLYLACRSKAKFDTALATVVKANPEADKVVKFLELDLSSFASIKAAADQFLAESDRLDILVNNAAIMGAPPGVTPDGYEVHFGVNYLGHAFLTKLLLPLLQKTTHFPNVEKGDVRVVNVSSTAGWNLAPRSKDGIDLEKEKTDMADTHSYMRYGSSKLAQIVNTREYARRYPEIMTTVLHPGRVKTTLLDGFMEKQKWNYMAVFQRAYDRAIGPMTTEQGALCQLWCATAAAGEMENGGLYVPVGVRISGNKLCNDAALGKRLWDWSEEQFREKGSA